DVLLTSAAGQCIRFAVDDVRVFQGRTSMGVRGIALGEGDKVISLSILRHVEATADERMAYLKRASAVRRGGNGDAEERLWITRRPRARSSSARRAMRSFPQPNSSCSPFPKRDTASARHHTNIAPPVAAAKASSPWPSPKRTAGW